MAISVALSGTIGARLQNSGELLSAYRARPFAVLAVTIPYGISGIAAVLYFSWAYLDWKQIVTFFAAVIALTYWDSSSQDRSAIWTLFIGSVFVAVLAEVSLLSPG